MAEMWTLKYLPRKVKTLKPRSWPRCIFWTPAQPCMSTGKRKPWSSPSRCPSGPRGLQGACPSPWMAAVAEADFKEGLLPHREAKSGGLHYTCIAKAFFFLFSPSSLRVAASKLLPTHSRVHEPLSRAGDGAREHEPKNTPGTVQLCGSLQASPVHEAMILFMGTRGAWIVHGS